MTMSKHDLRCKGTRSNSELLDEWFVLTRERNCCVSIGTIEDLERLEKYRSARLQAIESELGPTLTSLRLERLERKVEDKEKLKKEEISKWYGGDFVEAKKPCGSLCQYEFTTWDNILCTAVVLFAAVGFIGSGCFMYQFLVQLS